ncbi:MAG: alanine racemase [Bacilli bacterium]|nr:alanine racemase [Bacilli bacterium]
MKNIININLNNLKYNIEEIQRKMGKEIMCVLKSNAYNLSARYILKYLIKFNVKFFVFNHYEEYLECSDLLKNKKVLILETVKQKYLNNIPSNVRLSINTINDVEKYKDINALFHLQIDTGMNRDGIKDVEFTKKVKEIFKDRLEGIYTHYISDKDEQDVYLKQQLKFNEHLLTSNFKIIHSAATSSLSKNIIGNYVRVGMGMYGYHTSLNLKSVVNVYSHITSIRDVRKFETVGYGIKYISEQDEKIGIVPIGYYEGFKGRYMHYKKQIYPVIGKICMNHTFIRVNNETKNYSLLNIFPNNDKIDNKEEANYYEVLTSYRNFSRIYFMEYQNDIRKIFKTTNKKGFSLKQRTRSY